MKRKIEYGPSFQRLNSYQAETCAFMESKTRIEIDTRAARGLNMKGLLFANRESRKGPSQPAFSLSMSSTRDE